MGFLGLFKHRKEDLTATPSAEEPEFLKEIEDTVIPKGTIREEVEPELALWLSNGTTARNLKELAAALKRMSAKDYKEHVSEERNEIAEWAQEILNDEELARQLRKARTKLKSAQCVEKRIKQLKAGKKTGKKVVEVKAEEQVPEIQEILPITEMPLPVETRKPSFSVWPFKRKKQEEAAEETMAQLPEIPALTEETKSPELPEIPVEEPETAEAQPEPQPIGMEERPAQEELTSAEETEPAYERQSKITKHETKSHEEATLERKEQELEIAEKELDVEEDRLNKKRLEMTRKRYDLIKQKGEIEREKFELFMKKQKLSKQKEEILADTIEPVREMKGMPDFRLAGAYGKERLEALLEEAKQHIRENNVEQARNALQEVQSVLSTTFMTSSDKKQLEYEILEVEADLKLASLG